MTDAPHEPDVSPAEEAAIRHVGPREPPPPPPVNQVMPETFPEKKYEPPQIQFPHIPGSEEQVKRAGEQWAATLEKERQQERKHPREESGVSQSQAKRVRTVPEEMKTVDVAEESKPMVPVLPR